MKFRCDTCAWDAFAGYVTQNGMLELILDVWLIQEASWGGLVIDEADALLAGPTDDGGGSDARRSVLKMKYSTRTPRDGRVCTAAIVLFSWTAIPF